MIEASSFYSPAGLVEFDTKGSVLSKLTFEQFVPKSHGFGYDLVKVAVYDTRTSTITTLRNLSFVHHDSSTLRSDGIPDSVCSYPCGPAQYRIQKEPVCCWECRYCRNNEILVNDFTGCEECAKFTWPDSKARLSHNSSLECKTKQHRMCDGFLHVLPQLHLALRPFAGQGDKNTPDIPGRQNIHDEVKVHKSPVADCLCFVAYFGSESVDDKDDDEEEAMVTLEMIIVIRRRRRKRGWC
ncbi:metabotropic glutamate receptor-like [Plakobranchus ocellatus]|uniref:Metabotropic glutamate receptor-like n=1 Tax=Plakobranchus ocellatus TaxID=259542 RepID=A0AAV4A4K5_9GAST|nr:metabotropic glutamate receptor-like [Plakobranchus ocellatus]